MSFSDRVIPARPRPHSARTTTAAVVGLAALLTLGGGTAFEARNVPGRLSDAQFWKLVTDLSEAGGTFPSENLVSNETEFQTVIPALQTVVKPGGVYVGVGPDQNFTYISALKPAMAFIVDIRRQNLLHHLLYKAIMEMSPTRADFLTRLFGRPRPQNVDEQADAGVLFAAYLAADEAEGAYDKNLRDVITRLRGHHGFDLSLADERTIGRILHRFHTEGPDIAYATSYAGVQMFDGTVVRMSIFPGFADLMVQTDREGLNHSYLADEPRYRVVREMQLRNLIVPVVGDFAGPKAVRAVGAYVRARNARISTFYTSNVEQYLFQNGVWQDYYDNVATMPLDATSRFIRAFFPSSQGGRFRIVPSDPRSLYVLPTDPPQTLGGRPLPSRGTGFIESSSLVCSIQELLRAVDQGEIRGYLDVVTFQR